MSETVAIQAAPGVTDADERLLEVSGLKVYFPITRGIVIQRRIGDVRAVDGVSLTLRRGETLGLVGESG
jgi:ABC-type oligopeptide transport system ATPase subunit